MSGICLGNTRPQITQSRHISTPAIVPLVGAPDASTCQSRWWSWL